MCDYLADPLGAVMTVRTRTTVQRSKSDGRPSASQGATAFGSWAESGRLRQGDRGELPGDRRRMAFMLTVFSVGPGTHPRRMATQPRGLAGLPTSVIASSSRRCFRAAASTKSVSASSGPMR